MVISQIVSTLQLRVTLFLLTPDQGRLRPALGTVAVRPVGAVTQAILLSCDSTTRTGEQSGINTGQNGVGGIGLGFWTSTTVRVPSGPGAVPPSPMGILQAVAL